MSVFFRAICFCLFGVGELRATLCATDVGTTYANKLKGEFVITKKNHLCPCLGGVVWGWFGCTVLCVCIALESVQPLRGCHTIAFMFCLNTPNTQVGF